MNDTRQPLLQPGLHGAFVSDGFGHAPEVHQQSGALDGLRLAVKDVFDIAGLRTGAGNPFWWRQQAVAEQTAPAVMALLAAGARWIGKTVTDELAFSLAGKNLHYGTPVNPASPSRLPGGSSSGSAVAVAAADADIALATDCGGSARLPASYCGVWGMRPTHGRVPPSGFPLAPSFDTVGWFARTGDVMAKVLTVLLPGPQDAPASYLMPDDVLDACDPAVQAEMEALRARLASSLPLRTLARDTLPLEAWAQAHRLLQGAEIWTGHGGWVNLHGHRLADDVKARFIAASQVSATDIAQQAPVRRDARELLSRLLNRGTVMLMPTVPGVAPPLAASPADLANQRERAQRLLSPAGLAGLPQVSMPWIDIDGAPVGLSVVGARGADALVLEAARIVERALR